MTRAMTTLIAAIAVIFSVGFAQAARGEDEIGISVFVIDGCMGIQECRAYEEALNEVGESVAEELTRLLPAIAKKESTAEESAAEDSPESASIKNRVYAPPPFDHLAEPWSRIKDAQIKQKFNRLIVIRAESALNSKNLPQLKLQGWTLGENFQAIPTIEDMPPAEIVKLFELSELVSLSERAKDFVNIQHRSRFEFFGTKRVNLGCVVVSDEGSEPGLAGNLDILIDRLKANASAQWKNLEAFQALAEKEGLTGYTFVYTDQSTPGGNDCGPVRTRASEQDHYVIKGVVEPVEIADPASPEAAGLSSAVEIQFRIKRAGQPQEKESDFRIRFQFKKDPFGEYVDEIKDISCTIARGWSAESSDADLLITCSE